MDPEKLRAEIQENLQNAASLLNLNYLEGTIEERALIEDIAHIKPHNLSWFKAIQVCRIGRGSW